MVDGLRGRLQAQWLRHPFWSKAVAGEIVKPRSWRNAKGANSWGVFYSESQGDPFCPYRWQWCWPELWRAQQPMVHFALNKGLEGASWGLYCPSWGAHGHSLPPAGPLDFFLLPARPSRPLYIFAGLIMWWFSLKVPEGLLVRSHRWRITNEEFQ